MASTISAGTTSGTAIAIAGDTTGALALQTNGTTTAVTIDTSQNVGIGTTSPTQKITLNGNMLVTGGAYAIGLSNNFYAGIVGDSSGDNLYYKSYSNHIWKTTTDAGANSTGTERMRIDSSGNLLVNTTSQISGTAGKMNLYYSRTTHDGFAIQCDSTNTGLALVFTNPNGKVGQISTSGSATTYTTSSDYRLKKDIAPMTGALATVSALKPVTYKWKIDGSNGQGFIAHELQEICPDAVSGTKDALNKDGDIEPQGIDTSFLVATLTAAIQELNAKVDAQAAEIQALKAENT